MQNDEAIKILARHLMQCGALMPIDWVQKNGEGSEFMQAYKMAMDALKKEPVRCKDCKRWNRFKDTFGACKTGLCIIHNTRIGECDFCSYGERREGE